MSCLKHWSAALCAAVILTLAFGLPFRAHDTAKLLPLKTVQAALNGAQIRILSEQGEGRGATWQEAVDDLRKSASGEVFFDTAEQLVLCREAVTLLPQIVQAGTLRPAAQVFRAERLSDAETLNDYLNAHGGGVTVGDVAAALARGETLTLPETEGTDDAG